MRGCDKAAGALAALIGFGPFVVADFAGITKGVVVEIFSSADSRPAIATLMASGVLRNSSSLRSPT